MTTFGASRITVNRALRELQLAGIIDRRAGSGSYVRAQPERSYTFGLLIPDLGQTEIFEPICRGIALAEETEHSHALLWSKAFGDTEPKESQATELCQRMVREKVAGAFFAPLELTPIKDAVNQVIVQTFDRAGIPIVLLDRDLVAYPARSRYDVVGIDNRRAGYAITRTSSRWAAAAPRSSAVQARRRPSRLGLPATARRFSIPTAIGRRSSCSGSPPGTRTLSKRCSAR